MAAYTLATVAVMILYCDEGSEDLILDFAAASMVFDDGMAAVALW
jgi:hypothetical protein